jgi:hypothetical protein
MIERDYIMRMIDLLSKVMARAFFLRKTLELPKAADELAAAARNLLGLDRELIRMMSDTQLIELLSTDESLSASKCYVLGMLLKEDADLSLAQGNRQEATALQIKSLNLLITAFLESGNDVVPSHRTSLDEVLVSLSDVQLPPHISEKIVEYCELTGRYDKAEDMLFTLIEDDPRYIPKGLEFYQRLLTKSSDELSRGNLPRSEVEEALQELKQRQHKVS